MQITLLVPVIESLVFGLVVAGVYLLIAGTGNPWPWRQWLGYTWCATPARVFVSALETAPKTTDPYWVRCSGLGGRR